MYELKFPQAQALFIAWEARHPGEALGASAEAASILFQEFDRQGILTSDFFLDDDRLLGGAKGTPDPQLRAAFTAAVRKAQGLAQARLKSNPVDVDALFALTVATGMLADYTGILERRQLESLRLMRQADTEAKNLLKVDPNAVDAYLALGVANYIIGCLPGYKRFIIGMGGFHGDRVAGMQQVSVAAASGHYLRPFAKLMLALAAMREKKWDLARKQLTELVAEFPENPKFPHELRKINTLSASVDLHP